MNQEQEQIKTCLIKSYFQILTLTLLLFRPLSRGGDISTVEVAQEIKAFFPGKTKILYHFPHWQFLFIFDPVFFTVRVKIPLHLLSEENF